MAYANEMVQGGLSFGQAGSVGGFGGTLAATGSTITDAATVTQSITIVSGADGTVGVKLSGQTGDEVWLFNNSASTLKVYGDSSTVAITVTGTGLGTAGTAFSHLTYKPVLYKKQSATQWFALVGA